jgi:enoyl-CoA hydratase
MGPTETRTSSHVRFEARGPVAVVTIDRPEALNALTHETLRQLEEAIRRFHDDAALGVLIVTGGGEKSFVAGADIGELASLDPRGMEELSRYGQHVLGLLERGPKPVIAAVNGYALGGGCELALACHVRIASDNAVLGLPEVKLGIIPGYGGTQRLPRLLGTGRALELILSGRNVKAEEAAAIGLVNRVVPRADLIAEAEKLAKDILKNGPLALAAAIDAVTRGRDMNIEDAQRFESSLFGLLASSRDTREGFAAFLEKRPASFERR